jgi:DNA-binding transcriptional regulator YdaS (Cro superfamily)
MANTSYPSKAALDRAWRIVGSKGALTEAVGLKKQGMTPYYEGERPFPSDYCPVVERLTSEAGEPVLCEELRPDIPWGVLRKPSRKAAARLRALEAAKG